MLLIDDIKKELAVSQLSGREMRIVEHYLEVLIRWGNNNYQWIFDRCLGDITGQNRHPDTEPRKLENYLQGRNPSTSSGGL